MNTVMSVVMAWALAVFFACETNRKWVFYRKADTREKAVREVISFFECHLASEVIDLGLMFVYVDLMY